MSQVKIGSIDPAKLKPNPWNTNVVSPDNEAKLEESVKRFGMFKPVVVRTLADGSLQILGGEHRAQVAARMGLAEIPVVNLGMIDDKKAKEISLVDNGRYGADDTLRLAELLKDIGDVDSMLEFMPYSEADFQSIFASETIDLDMLSLGDEDEMPTSLPAASSAPKSVQTHQLMRFKVPVEDVEAIQKLITKTMKVQGFTGDDALTNAGDALVHLLNKVEP